MIVKSKMQPKDDYIQLASLFKLFGDGTRVQSYTLWNRVRCVYVILLCYWGNEIRNLTPVKGIASCEFGKIP